MKNKLHIFGCSHSGHIADMTESSSKTFFWGDYLSQKMDLKLYPRVGHAGKNSEYILLDIYDRILNNDIDKDDYVILNTSHSMRFGTPRLQQYVKHPMDVDFDSKHILGIDVKQSLKIDELKPDLTFDLWYHQTFGAWKLLDSVCDNVYQWILDDKNELDETYFGIQSFYKNKKDDNSLYQMSNYPIRNNKIILNEWKNLLVPPAEYKTWWDWMKAHKRGEWNYHVHPEHHSLLANILFEQILKIEKT